MICKSMRRFEAISDNETEHPVFETEWFVL